MLQPINGYVIVERIENKKDTKLTVIEKQNLEENIGRVIAVCKGTNLRYNDKIIFSLLNGAIPIKVHDKQYYAVKEEDVIAFLTE